MEPVARLHALSEHGRLQQSSRRASHEAAPWRAPPVLEAAPARLREAARYMRFATAAYGHALMAGFGPAGCARAPSASALLRGVEAVDLEAICRHCGLENESDVVLQREGDEHAGCPAFFVALDKPRTTIVLSIRGTASIYDAVVHDLVCESARRFEGVPPGWAT